MTIPRISVVIPIYNHEQYVVACIESIVDQYDPNVQIVGIDDGSSDGSYAAAREYLSKTVARDCWRLERRENRGINRTLNELISKSDGEIIVPLASDDMLAPNALAHVRKAYFAEANRCQLFFYDVSTMDQNGLELSASTASLRRGGVLALQRSKLYLACEIVLGWNLPFAHQFYSREYFDRFGPYPEDIKYEDLWFALKAISLDHFGFVPAVCKRYRVRLDHSFTPGLSTSDSRQEYIRSQFVSSDWLAFSVILRLGALIYSRPGGLVGWGGKIIARVLRVIVSAFAAKCFASKNP
jgi:glycosyltransferase involved in cell wall biosynthesis